jgi:phage baseplate assembly protein V
MTPDLPEILTAIANMIRIGSIVAVDGAKARVKLSPTLTTNWLNWISFRAGDVVTWCAPAVGEQVIVFSPGGDLLNGRILAGLYSVDSPAPESSRQVHATHYPDGAIIRYDFAAHRLTATLPGGTAIIQADAVTSDAPETTCTGNLNVNGNLTVTGVSALNNGAVVKGGNDSAAMEIAGDVNATGDIKAGDISLRNHKHGEIKRGDEQSGGPLP